MTLQVLRSYRFKLIWLLLIFFPVYWDNLPIIEGWIFPVTTKIKIVEYDITRDGKLRIFVDFNKTRRCRFLGLSMVKGREKLLVEFGDRSDAIDSRPVGEYTAGPWFIDQHDDFVAKFGVETITDMDGIEIMIYHSCHPLWETHTKVFP